LPPPVSSDVVGKIPVRLFAFEIEQPVLIDIVNRFLCDRGTTSIRLAMPGLFRWGYQGIVVV